MAGDGPYFFHGGEVYKAPEFGVPELRNDTPTSPGLMPTAEFQFDDCVQSNGNRAFLNLAALKGSIIRRTGVHHPPSSERPRFSLPRNSLTLTRKSDDARPEGIPKSPLRRLLNLANRTLRLGSTTSNVTQPLTTNTVWKYRGAMRTVMVEFQADKNGNWSYVWGNHSSRHQGWHNYSHLLTVQPPINGTVRLGLPLQAFPSHMDLHVRTVEYSLELLLHSTACHAKIPPECRLGWLRLPDYIEPHAIEFNVNDQMLVVVARTKLLLQSTSPGNVDSRSIYFD